MASFSSQSLRTRAERKAHSPLNLKFIFGAIGVFLLLFIYLIWSVGSTQVMNGKYTIEKGYTVTILSEKLGFGVASWRYRLWVRYVAPKNITISAGTYETKTPVTITDFLTKTIKAPLFIDQQITILPGWSSYDIDAYLANKDIGGIGDFIEVSRLNFSEYQKDFPFLKGVNSLEGFLYPDTYRLRQDATTDDAIRVMLKEFSKKIGTTYITLDTKKAYETLILASIVEREERGDTNQAIVAGILSKRVKEGIAMGADATVCYGYAKTQKQCTPSFIGSVIQERNPYNTRNKQGYTPTPISNFPLSTWNAALRPEVSQYYYYLHGSDGQIHYGKTNEEHIANKKYL